MITIFIFIVGLLVSSAVVYALFAYTIHEMGTNENDKSQEDQKTMSFDSYASRKV